MHLRSHSQLELLRSPAGRPPGRRNSRGVMAQLDGEAAAWMEAHGLTEYSGRLAGWCSGLRDVLELLPRDIDELGMKRVHRRRFEQAIDDLRRTRMSRQTQTPDSSTHSSGSWGGERTYEGTQELEDQDWRLAKITEEDWPDGADMSLTADTVDSSRTAPDDEPRAHGADHSQDSTRSLGTEQVPEIPAPDALGSESPARSERISDVSSDVDARSSELDFKAQRRQDRPVDEDVVEARDEQIQILPGLPAAHPGAPEPGVDASAVLEQLLVETLPALYSDAVRSACTSIAMGHVEARRAKLSEPQLVLELLVAESLEEQARSIVYMVVEELIQEYFLDRTAEAIIEEELRSLGTKICISCQQEVQAENIAETLVALEVGSWVRNVVKDTVDELHGANTADAIRKDKHEAEALVTQGLGDDLLLRSLCTVVQSQANNVLTDEVVEQLLDTTLALVTIESAVQDTQAAAATEENIVLRQWHAELASRAAFGVIVGRLDMLLDAWAEEEAKADQNDLKAQRKANVAGALQSHGSAVGGRSTAADNITAKEMEHTDAELRDWLAAQQQELAHQNTRASRLGRVGHS